MNKNISTIITRTQDAVDIVNKSEHSTNKIASCLFKGDKAIAQTNYRPALLAQHFSIDQKIGNSSQSIHSEIACIFNADFPVEGASLCITDPCCPNCAKAIAESGITHVYIDHKGMDKDFIKRRGNDFESLSLFILEKAGIPVSIVYRKENRVEPLIAPSIQTQSRSAQNIEFFDIPPNKSLEEILHEFRQTRQAHAAWVIAKVQEQNGKQIGILAFESLPPGLTPHDYEEKRQISAKYRLPVDPLNKLLCFISRTGGTLINAEIASNLLPSPRALVNAVGFGVETLYIGEKTEDHEAASLLRENNIIAIRPPHHSE